MGSTRLFYVAPKRGVEIFLDVPFLPQFKQALSSSLKGTVFTEGPVWQVSMDMECFSFFPYWVPELSSLPRMFFILRPGVFTWFISCNQRYLCFLSGLRPPLYLRLCDFHPADTGRSNDALGILVVSGPSWRAHDIAIYDPWQISCTVDLCSYSNVRMYSDYCCTRINNTPSMCSGSPFCCLVILC